LDNYNYDLGTKIKNEDKKSLKYNKLILKLILTTSFGSEFSNFVSKQGQAHIISENHKRIKEQLQDKIKNNFLIKKKYNELDFLNLILFLEEWQKKYFIWDEKYTSLMFSINKDGEKYKGKMLELKDFIISFIKEKRYLYFPFGRYNEENIFITLDDEMYKNTENKKNNMILERKETNLYEIIPVKYEKIDLEYNKEIGYLLSYNKDEVCISVVIYDKKNEKIECVNEHESFTKKMIEILEKHFIL
jgi:hypothetical protein